MKTLEDPTFVAKSEQAKKNRKGGSLSNPIEPSHFQGSISASEHAKKKEAYQKKLDECKEQGVEKNPNEIYWEAVGGRKKGVVPGLGTSSDLYYGRPSRRGGCSSNAYT